MKRILLIITISIFLFFPSLIPVAFSAVITKPQPKLKIADLQDKEKVSPSALIDRANYLLTEKNMPDSALMYYSYVSNYLTDHISDKDAAAEKVRALNNIGYTYFYYFRDYQKAHYYLKKTIELAEKYRQEQIIPYSLINLGHIYLTYQGLFDMESYWTKAMNYYNDAFKESVRLGNGEMTVISFLALAHQAIEHNDLSWINKETAEALRRVDPHTRLYRSAEALLHAIGSLQRHNAAGAIAILEKSYAGPPEGEMGIREKILTGHHLVSLRHRLNPTDDPIPALKRLAVMCDSSGQTDIAVDIFNTMYEFTRENGNGGRADDYYHEYLKRKDSLVNKSKIYNIDHLELSEDIDNMERELDFRGRQRQTHLIIIIMMVIILTVLAIFSVNVIRKKRVLEEKNRLLFDQAQQALRQPTVSLTEGDAPSVTDDHGNSQDPEEKKKKYYYSTLEKENVEGILTRLNEYMETSQDIYNSDFSLTTLAEALGEKEAHISQILNEYLGKNFRTFLNECRIREASRRLIDRKGYGRYSIEAIAESVGFKSRTNFISVFKQFTGLTPSEYRKIGEDKAKQTD